MAKGADHLKSINEMSLLEYAIESKLSLTVVGIVKVLGVNVHGASLLFRAIKKDFLFDFLVQEGVNLSLQDTNGDTVLLSILRHSSYKALKVLTNDQIKEQINIKNNNGESALFFLMRYNEHRSLIESLLKT